MTDSRSGGTHTQMKYVLLAVLIGCGDSELPAVKRTEIAVIPVAPSAQLDMLFVIDNSPDILDTQEAFLASFPSLLGELATLESGMPDLHIGIVSSDVGTLGFADSEPGPAIPGSVGGCADDGDGGALQHTSQPAVLTTNPPDYPGSLVDAFRSNGSLGGTGCGFEQHLASAQRALDGYAANPEFLRPEANLAIFVLTEEDDCSFEHATFLSSDESQYGPLQSFRCTRFGVTCDGGGQTPDEMNAIGPKTACHASDADVLVDLDEFATFFKGLKSDPRRVMMGSLTGVGAPVAVEGRAPSGSSAAVPALVHACANHDSAEPSIRIPELASRFANGVNESICVDDYNPAQASFGRHARNLLGDTCLPQPIAMPANCVVVDQHADTTETPIPFSLTDDPGCSASQLRVSAPTATDTIVVRCALPEQPSSDAGSS